MTTVKEIYECLDRIAPYAASEGFDNNGLQCGDWMQKVNRVLLCVDCIEDTVEEAIRRQCELIIAHHPLIFPEIRQICEQDTIGRILRTLIRHGISLVSAHTSLDNARGGLCDVMAQLIGLKNDSVIESESGYGRIGRLESTTVAMLARQCANVFEARGVRYTGDGTRVVQQVAVASGSGTSCAEAALASGAECLITGDVKYSQALTWLRKGLTLIDVGHYDTEKVILPVLVNCLQTELAGVQCFVDLYVSASGRDVFTLA